MGSLASDRTAGAGPLTAAAWLDAACLCGVSHGERLLVVPHEDAPGGVSFVMRCGGCGLRRLSPRPAAGTLARYYGEGYNAFVGRTRAPLKQRGWNMLRDSYTRARGPARLAAPLARWAFDINVRVPAGTRPRVVEVGCGYGDLLAYLRERGCDVQGIDLDPRAAAAGAALGVPIHTGTIDDFPGAPASFDVAVMCHSLEHVPDPDTTIRGVARLLRPGGRLHVAVPNGEAAALAVQGRRWMHLSHPLHFWFFDRSSLTALLERHRLRVDSAWTTSRWHHLSAWAHRVTAGDGAAASRELAQIARRSSASRWTGDVLRVAATRVA